MKYLFILALISGVAGAAVTEQSKTFTIIKDYPATSSSGSDVIGNRTYFSATFQPFDEESGTLVSFTVEWTVYGTMEGTIGPSSGGGVSSYINGGMYVGAANFGGGGIGGNSGGGANQDYTMTISGTAYNQTHLLSGTPNAALLAAVTGDSPYVLSWDVGLNISYPAITGAHLDFSSTVKVIYTTADTVPEPAVATLGVLGAVGLLRRRRQG